MGFYIKNMKIFKEVNANIIFQRLINFVIFYQLFLIFPVDNLYDDKNNLVIIFIGIISSMIINDNNKTLTWLYASFVSLAFSIILLVNFNIIYLQQDEMDISFIFIVSSILCSGIFKIFKDNKLHFDLTAITPFVSALLIGEKLTHIEYAYFYIIIAGIGIFLTNIIRKQELQFCDIAEIYSWFALLAALDGSYIKIMYFLVLLLLYRYAGSLYLNEKNGWWIKLFFYFAPILINQSSYGLAICLYLIGIDMILFRFKDSFSGIEIGFVILSEYYEKMRNNSIFSNCQINFSYLKFLTLNLSVTISIIFIIIGLLSMV